MAANGSRRLAFVFAFALASAAGAFGSDAGYAPLGESEAVRIWKGFRSADYGARLRPEPGLELRKFSVVDREDRRWNLLVVCRGECVNFTCSREYVRVGCLPSARCRRTEFAYRPLPGEDARWRWLEGIARDEIPAP